VNRSDLSPRQLEVVEAHERKLLVTGGAGAGKTTTALWTAREDLERPGNETKRALFLTFSRTAVDQIMSRSRSAVAPVEDRIEVATFHSFAFRLVRRFGFVTGVSGPNPSLQSASEARLLGKAPDRLDYDQLVPLALRVLDDPGVAELLERRWCVVICDEFQDTGDAQWALLDRLSLDARLLLLGDEHQLIYGFLASSGVAPRRMTQARQWVDRVIELEPASHRDPSGAIPALATAVRTRDFTARAVLAAIEDGRLRIRTGVEDDDLVDAIASSIDASWDRGCRTFGVFAHSNQTVAELSYRLNEAGIDHYLVGLPEAEAEALSAMLMLTQFGTGESDWASVRISLGTYLTACSRGRKAPPLAKSLASGAPLPPGLEDRLERIQSEISGAAAESLIAVAELAASTWGRLGMTTGQAPWERSAPAFKALVRNVSRIHVDQMSNLASAVEQLRLGAMLESQRRRLPPVQVMNLHQTKGREADSVVILCGDDDCHGDEDEPFIEASRLLYVILTRARIEVTIIFGHGPHPLVAPLAGLT
jgi:DNA helicase-2/ATP-dependent DNA helicase PcrA